MTTILHKKVEVFDTIVLARVMTVTEKQFIVVILGVQYRRTFQLSSMTDTESDRVSLAFKSFFFGIHVGVDEQTILWG